MKKLITFFLLTTAILSYAQIGINTPTPDASSALEISSANKGFLPPRMTLISSTDGTTIPNPASGLTVYHTGNSALEAGLYTNIGTPAVPNWTRGAIINETQGSLVKKIKYEGTSSDGTKTVQIGPVEFRFSPVSYTVPEMRFLAPLTSNTIANYHSGQFVHATSGTSIAYQSQNRTYTSANWNVWQNLAFSGSDGLNTLERNEVWLSIQNDPDAIYCVQFVILTKGASNIYSIIATRY
ncbi:hypothetical protein ASG22_19015 [Chryseobacterium sp. Leaf405]|uniref:hypothetical protein n=1 Tax=Chryseobacterium sp. Leaf405 TaxID=1736367 RepID=UPI0006F2D9D7|nr:hypothetical protein [Chryseobacterium sp. Leaf405]KQT31126.1 hypothetical protein ASG22_19015 [Chryseobacterium sp. Leaf405]